MGAPSSTGGAMFLPLELLLEPLLEPGADLTTSGRLVPSSSSASLSAADMYAALTLHSSLLYWLGGSTT